MTADPIRAGARTVAHTATYLDELRRRAIDLRDTLGVGDAGYFTPSAEQQVKSVYFSYLQARAALYDLVLNLHREAEHEPRAFVVGYAGALLLIDAARFMVRTFAADPIVRRKLNEPDPTLGIPPSSFDQIGRSLTRSRHAWQLYHARRFYQQNRQTLSALRDDPLIAPAFDVIDSRDQALDVTVGTFIKAKLQLRYNRITRRVNDFAVGRMLYGLQEMLSRMAADLTTAPRHRPSLPPDVRAQFVDMLRPGDVLVVRKEHALTNYFLPGYWPHAALHIGDGCVLEAMKDGVWRRPLDSPFGSDALAVIRPRLSETDIAAALRAGMGHEGKPYDFDFDFTRSDRMVCSEVVYRTYDGVGGMRFTLTRRAGRMTLAAEDLLRMAVRGECFDVVAVYVPGQPLTTDPAALERTLNV